MIKPILEQEFKPAIIEIRNFFSDVASQAEKTHLIIALERDNGYTYVREFDVFKEGVDDKRNTFIVERFIKTLLWVVGGYKVYIYGSKKIYEDIKSYYQLGGLREFDFNFMSTVYETKFEVIYVDNILDMPKERKCSLPMGGFLDGNRVGFDAGGSDIKISSVVNGEVIHSEEILWLPKLNEDISYHYEHIYNAMKKAIDIMGGKCDGIGVSTAGVIINNKPMVSSLFIKVDKQYFKQVKQVYINTVNRLSEELGHEIPFVVANDGDVTALAGAIDLKDNSVLGIAMGTSEAVGYVDPHGNLTGYLNELAFAPVDFNLDAMVDEWSGDFGVGCKYFSQDAVIKLAEYGGFKFEDGLTPAQKLKVIQALMAKDDPLAAQIYEDIGVYLAHTIPFYAKFYDIKHMLLLGRVMGGKGGDVILATCKETLAAEYPEFATLDIGLPDEKNRRVGQSIAAASLPATK